MLSHIDRELFPDRCEVVVLRDPQRYVYPIFKNGRSALLKYSRMNHCRTLMNEQIARVQVIEIYLRDPIERFASGINTFCQLTLRDHPYLDAQTVTWFAEKYLFLDRHYAPQFSWLINLSRFARNDCKFSLRPVSQLKQSIGLVEPDGIEPTTVSDVLRVTNDTKSEMYVRLDQSLLRMIGRDVTIGEVCQHIKIDDPAAWHFTVGKNQEVLQKCIVQG